MGKGAVVKYRTGYSAASGGLTFTAIYYSIEESYTFIIIVIVASDQHDTEGIEYLPICCVCFFKAETQSNT